MFYVFREQNGIIDLNQLFICFPKKIPAYIWVIQILFVILQTTNKNNEDGK